MPLAAGSTQSFWMPNKDLVTNWDSTSSPTSETHNPKSAHPTPYRNFAFICIPPVAPIISLDVVSGGPSSQSSPGGEEAGGLADDDFADHAAGFVAGDGAEQAELAGGVEGVTVRLGFAAVDVPVDAEGFDGEVVLDVP